MAVRADRITVQTTATRIDVPGLDNRDGTSLVLRCPTADVYLGGDDVTTATGFVVPTGVSYSHDLSGTDTLYAVAAAPVEVHVLRAGI